jgi:hypothetical protein
MLYTRLVYCKRFWKVRSSQLTPPPLLFHCVTTIGGRIHDPNTPSSLQYILILLVTANYRRHIRNLHQ